MPNFPLRDRRVPYGKCDGKVELKANKNVQNGTQLEAGFSGRQNGQARVPAYFYAPKDAELNEDSTGLEAQN